MRAPLSFRPLERSDFPLLQQRLAAPHVAAWWKERNDRASVEAKYGPRVDGAEPTRCGACPQSACHRMARSVRPRIMASRPTISGDGDNCRAVRCLCLSRTFEFDELPYDESDSQRDANDGGGIAQPCHQKLADAYTNMAIGSAAVANGCRTGRPRAALVPLPRSRSP
jgi:hypothetical protein